MNYLMKTILLLILLLPVSVLSREHHTKRHGNSSHKSDSYFRTQQGWDISSGQARRASNCYHYSLYAEGGRGSARIMSLPGKNYIQVDNGRRSGYVCFNGPTTLELGKLANRNIYVEFDIEDIGVFYFDSGEQGSKRINNWFRSYWGL